MTDKSFHPIFVSVVKTGDLLRAWSKLYYESTPAVFTKSYSDNQILRTLKSAAQFQNQFTRIIGGD